MAERLSQTLNDEGLQPAQCDGIGLDEALVTDSALHRGYDGFVRRMSALRPHLDAMGVRYHPEPDLGWDGEPSDTRSN